MQRFSHPLRRRLRTGRLAVIGASLLAALASILVIVSPADAAVTAVNLGDRERMVPVPVAGRVPDGASFRDLVDDTDLTVVDGELAVTLAPRTARVLVADAGQDLVAPGAPMDLSASATTGRVDLAWAEVADAATYQVWRSRLSGGGYAPIGETTEPAFIDAQAPDGGADRVLDIAHVRVIAEHVSILEP